MIIYILKYVVFVTSLTLLMFSDKIFGKNKKNLENSSLYIGNISSIVIYVLIYFKNVGKGILQSILSSEMCLNSRKNEEKGLPINIPPRRLRLLKTRYIAFKNDTKKQGQNDLAFLLLFQIK